MSISPERRGHRHHGHRDILSSIQNGDGVKELDTEMKKYHCAGFKASGISAGIKKHQALDLGLIVSENPATVAGVFKKNRVKIQILLNTRSIILLRMPL